MNVKISSYIHSYKTESFVSHYIGYPMFTEAFHTYLKSVIFILDYYSWHKQRALQTLSIQLIILLIIVHCRETMLRSISHLSLSHWL